MTEDSGNDAERTVLDEVEAFPWKDNKFYINHRPYRETTQMDEIEDLLELAARPVDALSDEQLLEAFREVEDKRHSDEDRDPVEEMYLTRRSNTLGAEIQSRGRSLETVDGEIQYYDE